MKQKLPFSLSALFFFFSSLVLGQSYIGHTTGNHSGIHGVLLNPASVVDSHFRADINLLSASTFVGSDYFEIDLAAALESEDGLNFEENVAQSAKDNNQFFLNLDVLGPSFMFNLSKRSSLAITSRVRAFMNISNINGLLYENLESGFDEQGNFDFEMNNLTGTIHAWGELGLTYGRVLLDKENNFLKGGVSIKYLQGAGSLFVNAPHANGQYTAETQLLTTAGSLSYGNTPGFDSENIDVSNLSTGYGGDIGLAYEYRPNKDPDVISHSLYKFKLGVSITDIGSISYPGSITTTYNLDKTIKAERFEEEGLGEVLEEEYEGTEAVAEQEISLPTALHIVADYQIRKRLFLNLQGSFSLVSPDLENANRIINTLTATPRLETKWLSIYLPVSMRQYDGLAMGAGLRLGPVSVGSGSVISNYLGDSSKTTDVFVGVKIPIYR